MSCAEPKQSNCKNQILHIQIHVSISYPKEHERICCWLYVRRNNIKLHYNTSNHLLFYSIPETDRQTYPDIRANHHNSQLANKRLNLFQSFPFQRKIWLIFFAFEALWIIQYFRISDTFWKKSVCFVCDVVWMTEQLSTKWGWSTSSRCLHSTKFVISISALQRYQSSQMSKKKWHWDWLAWKHVGSFLEPTSKTLLKSSLILTKSFA